MSFFALPLTARTVSAVALHGVYRAVMGWPTPSEPLGKCGKVEIIQLLFGGSVIVTLYL